jgi:hypothetical protein
MFMCHVYMSVIFCYFTKYIKIEVKLLHLFDDVANRIIGTHGKSDFINHIVN